MKRLVIIKIFAWLIVLGILGCRRDVPSTDPALELAFSTDTLMFDTVFTTIGSATRNFKVYNHNNQFVEIQSVSLAGGVNSPYRINVDGAAGPRAGNILIGAHDSLYVFVEVTVDPTAQNAPLLIADSVVFVCNSHVHDVKLAAWGQDVYLHRAAIVTSDTVLTADKPHLIYDYMLGMPNATITIEAGARLHFHNNALLWVAGTLQAVGTHDNRIVFEGDRLEPFYVDKPGQWAGIRLNAGSRHNVLKWTQIKNAILGLQVDTCVTPGAPTLRLSHSSITSTSYVGLLAQGAVVEADNCLFANSAQACVALTLGGTYSFYHCTLANFWADYMYRQAPTLTLNNYYIAGTDGSLQARDLKKADFYNCIIYGSLNDELFIDNRYNAQTVDALMEYHFASCILRTTLDTANTAHFEQTSRQNPMFKDVTNLCFELDTLSPAKDAANVEMASRFNIDLNNYNRLTDTKPDIGAFERVETPQKQL